jgi:type IV secretion system protein VirB11
MPAAPVFLDAYLAPLRPLLERTDVTDIFINREGELWLETLGGKLEHHDLRELDAASMWRLARQIASLSHQGISREHPLLSARLPDGSRVQVIAPPATRGPMAIAIRKHVVADLSLKDYAASGALQPALGTNARLPREHLRALLDGGDAPGFLAAAVRERLNILVSGGTSTGKTTFLNALIKEIPESERLILIEDTPELRSHRSNMVGLVAVKGELGEARVTADDLLQASLRMRPDRIILGELRGTEAYTFLRAVNTGHPGSMTTLHADSAEGALQQLVLMVLQSGANLRSEDVLLYAHNVIDIVVQLGRSSGKRFVSNVQLIGAHWARNTDSNPE